MHGLELGSRLRLARCCRRLLQDAQHPFAWLPGGGVDVRVGGDGTLEIELFNNVLRMCRPRHWEGEDDMQSILLSLRSSPLLRYVPVRLHVLNTKGRIDWLEISRLQRTLFAFSCSALPWRGSLHLRSPPLAKLRWLSLGASINDDVNANLARLIAFDLPLLHTLYLIRSSDGFNWPLAALRCFLSDGCLPQLTSLECGGDAWQHCLGDAPFAGQLKRLTLVEGYTHEPDQIALHSSDLTGLRELHLQRWRNNHTWPNQLAPLQSMENCFAAELLALQRLTLDDVAGIDFVLAALPHLPLLCYLRMLVPFEEKPHPPSAQPSSAASSVPSLQALRALLERCPNIELLHLTVASRCVSVYSSGPCVMNIDELLPSARLCELRDGCKELPRTTVEFLVADHGH
jgi:hypothetical protein